MIRTTSSILKVNYVRKHVAIIKNSRLSAWKDGRTLYLKIIEKFGMNSNFWSRGKEKKSCGHFLKRKKKFNIEVNKSLTKHNIFEKLYAHVVKNLLIPILHQVNILKRKWLVEEKYLQSLQLYYLQAYTFYLNWQNKSKKGEVFTNWPKNMILESKRTFWEKYLKVEEISWKQIKNQNLNLSSVFENHFFFLHAKTFLL